MARIPDEVVERLKTDISVQRLAEARGVAFKQHGSDLIGRCPFHDDKTPSLVVTSGQEPVALLGRLPGRRHGDRLGDEIRGGELPACGGALAE